MSIDDFKNNKEASQITGRSIDSDEFYRNLMRRSIPVIDELVEKTVDALNTRRKNPTVHKTHKIAYSDGSSASIRGVDTSIVTFVFDTTRKDAQGNMVRVPLHIIPLPQNGGLAVYGLITATGNELGYYDEFGSVNMTEMNHGFTKVRLDEALGRAMTVMSRADD